MGCGISFASGCGGVGACFADLASDGSDAGEQDGQEADQDKAVVVAGLLDGVRGDATSHRGEGSAAEGKDQFAGCVVDADGVIGADDGFEADDFGGLGDIGDDFAVLGAGQFREILGTGNGDFSFADVMDHEISLLCGHGVGREVGLGLADEGGGEFRGLQGGYNIIECRGGYSGAHGEDEDRDHEECGEFFHRERPPVSCHNCK